MNELLLLIAQTLATDDAGDELVKETSREVFARLVSVGQREFYQGHAVGLKPELKFVLADYLDYQNEKEVEYNGIRYRVLRTFRNGNALEISRGREGRCACKTPRARSLASDGRGGCPESLRPHSVAHSH